MQLFDLKTTTQLRNEKYVNRGKKGKFSGNYLNYTETKADIFCKIQTS